MASRFLILTQLIIYLSYGTHSKIAYVECRLTVQCQALRVEMLTVAVALMTLTLSLRSASGF